MFPPGYLQVVSRNPEPLGGGDSTDSVQRELLPGEEQPDLQERLLAVTQVDIRFHTLTTAAFQSETLVSHIYPFRNMYCIFWSCPIVVVF